MRHKNLQARLNGLSRILIALLASVIGLYPALYFTSGEFGILANKDRAVLGNMLWNSAFYVHITAGGLALLLGWVQFSHKLRVANAGLHRNIGKTYMIAVLFSSLSAAFIAFYAAGGVIATLGFFCLAIVWFITTANGYTAIIKGDTERHQKMMMYSYAACLAAVSLRILLPLLVQVFKDFTMAYRIVAWACWVPNMLIAFLVARKPNRPLAG